MVSRNNASAERTPIHAGYTCPYEYPPIFACLRARNTHPCWVPVPPFVLSHPHLRILPVKNTRPCYIGSRAPPAVVVDVRNTVCAYARVRAPSPPPATLHLNQSELSPGGSAAVSPDKPEHSQPKNVTSGRSETYHRVAHVLILVLTLASSSTLGRGRYERGCRSGMFMSCVTLGRE